MLDVCGPGALEDRVGRGRETWDLHHQDPVEEGFLAHMPTGEPVQCGGDWLERHRLARWCSARRGR